MNGVPALRPQFPDYGNVLRTGAAIKGAESRNALTQMQLQDYPEDRNWLRKQRGFTEEDRAIAEKQRTITQEATAFGTALKSKNAKTAKQIYNALKPEGSKDIVDFTMDEKTTSVTYGDGTKIEGPISYVTEATEQIAKDPTWATDPEKTPHFAAWAAARGIKFTEAPKEYTVQQQIDDAVTFYKFKQRLLIDDTGFIKEGKEEEYDKLTESLAKDQRAILAGKKPSYLREEAMMQRKPGETIVDYLKRIK